MTAVGSYLPANVVSNEALSRRVDTDDEWIRRRTGIGQRHIVADGETTADLATAAATAALANGGLGATDIDLINCGHHNAGQYLSVDRDEGPAYDWCQGRYCL